jgi:hypothetical protein
VDETKLAALIDAALASRLGQLGSRLLRGPMADGPDGSRRKWGITARLLPSTATSITASAQAITLDAGGYDEERDVVVKLQALDLPPAWAIAGANTTGYIKASIHSYAGSGSDAFTKSEVVLTSNQIVEVPLTARRVVVSLAWLNVQSNPSSVTLPAGFLRVRAAVATTQTARIPGQRYAGFRWNRNGALYSDSALGATPTLITNVNGAPVAKSGHVHAAYGCLVTGGSSTAPLFVQLFDSAAAPAGGVAPIWCSDPLVAYQGFSFSDELIPGDVDWIYGLWTGLSSTPHVYTPGTGTYSLVPKAG